MSLPTQTLDPARKRVCLLVIGMHRSGTSALTHVLSLMGAALPQKLLGATLGNPMGHWEPVRLIEAHDALLAEVLERGKEVPEVQWCKPGEDAAMEVSSSYGGVRCRAVQAAQSSSGLWCRLVCISAGRVVLCCVVLCCTVLCCVTSWRKIGSTG